MEGCAAEGNAEAQPDSAFYAYRARKRFGACAATVGGVDALVFTGGIGKNHPFKRRRLHKRLQLLDLQLELGRNR